MRESCLTAKKSEEGDSKTGPLEEGQDVLRERFFRGHRRAVHECMIDSGFRQLIALFYRVAEDTIKGADYRVLAILEELL